MAGAVGAEDGRSAGHVDAAYILERELDPLHEVLAHAPLSIFAVEGPDYRLTWANEVVAGAAGTPRAQVIGRPFAEVMPLFFHAAREHIDRVLATGERVVLTALTVGTDLASGCHMDVTFAPIPGPEGRPRGVVLMGKDVTERKLAEAERAELYESEQRARREAELANRLKDEFLARVSHELATPLAAMKMWIHLLRTAGERGAQEQAKAAIDAIDQCARAQSKLIEDLLDVARGIGGKLRLTLEPFEPVPAVDAAVRAMRPQAEAKAIELAVDLDPTIGRVMGDRARLQQIASNLLSNAIKFTRERGHVAVSLRRAGGACVLEVRDDGRGIDKDVLPLLFAPFRQGDGSITREHGGLGLGLSIVQQLVLLHGGEVSAHSDGPGLGAVFRVTLPIAPGAPEGTSVDGEARPGAPPTIDGVDVLVVDDDDATREGLSLVLEGFGARVRASASAARALEEIERARPDVLLCDIAMPIDDGYSLIRRVRALDGPGASVPAAAITAHGRVEDKLRALAAGFQQHVAKPVDPAALAVIVARLAGRT